MDSRETHSVAAATAMDIAQPAGEDERTSSSSTTTPGVLRWIPFRWFLYADSERLEATGCSMDGFARGLVFLGSNLLLGPALLKLASEAAGCEETEGADCTKRIYGFRPSSLLSNVAIFSSLIVSLCLPIFGAIVDHTRFRKQVGVYTAVLAVVVNYAQSMIGPSTWFAVAIVQVVSWALFSTHNTAVFAYAYELSPKDVVTQSRLNTDFNISVNGSIILFLLVVLAPSFALNLSDEDTARVSQLVASTFGAIFFFVSWKYCFPPRPRRREVPPGSSLLTSGFRELIRTSSMIVKSKENPGLKWIIISISLSEAAGTSIVTLSATFASQVLRMSASETGLGYLIAVLGLIPGSRLGDWIARKFKNPIRSAMIGDVYLVITTIAAAVHLQGPQHKIANYMYSVLWGIGLGWVVPIHTTMFMAFVPQGAEAEMMGIYLFATDFLAFLPPLIFTALNEAGFSMNIGLASMSIYIVLAILFLFPVGRFEDARKLARPDIGSDSERTTTMTTKSDVEDA